MNEWVPDCSRDYSINNITLSKCSCQNCEGSCNISLDFFTNKKQKLYGFLSYWHFIFTILGICFFCIMTVIGLILYFRLKKQNEFSRRMSLLDECSHGSDDFIESPKFSKGFGAELDRSIDSDVETPFDTLYSVDHSDPLFIVILQSIMIKITGLCTKYSIYVIVGFTMLFLVFSIFSGFLMEITSDPVELWSPHNSKIHKQKELFDSSFGKFYRTEQIILTQKQKNLTITKDFIKEISKIITDIKNLESKYQHNLNYSQSSIIEFIKLKDVCVKPISPKNNECVIFSVMQYFQNNEDLLNKDKVLDHVSNCAINPILKNDNEFDDITCLSTFLSPVDPKLVFGGYKNKDYLNSTSLIITIALENPNDINLLQKAISWENTFINYLTKYNSTLYDISFSSENSVNDELKREAKMNILIVLISYIAMFFYVSIALGKIPKRLKYIFVDTKFLLGMIGVLLVFLSVISSIGFLSIFKIKINSIALEVLPFLILAVGVDNIFIITNAYYRNLEKCVQQGDYETNTIIFLTMKQVGPGIFISAISQCAIFCLGTISNVPVIKTFSIFATVALIFNFILQMTVFLSCFILDCKREKQQRLNLCCCFKINNDDSFLIGDSSRYCTSIVKIFINNVLGKLFKIETYRFIVFTIFLTIWILSISVIPVIHVGLDQTIALPQDSYLQLYYRDVFNKLKAGAPVYFVIDNGYQYEIPNQQEKICSFYYCDEKSIVNTIYVYSKFSNISRIALPSMAWLDVYLSWLRPNLNSESYSCCSIVSKIKNETKHPEIKIGQFCTLEMYKKYVEELDEIECKSCLSQNNKDNRPTEEEFGKYLPDFLNDIPSLDDDGCKFGGKPAFKNSVILNKNYYDNKTNNIPVVISNIMTYHTPLINSDDFVDALKKSIYISQNFTKYLGTNVFSYSVFYIYYEAFLDMRKTTYISLSICLVAVVIVSAILFSGNIRMIIIVTTTVLMMNVVNMAFIFITKMDLNPVSLVNLIMVFLIFNIKLHSYLQ